MQNVRNYFVVAAAALATTSASSAWADPAPSTGKSSEDTTTSTPTSPSDDDHAGWYQHQPDMPADPEPQSPPRQPAPPVESFMTLSALYDAYGFSAGTVHGAGGTFRASFAPPQANPIFEFFVGLYVPNGALYVGASLGRQTKYSFIPSLYKSRDLTIDVAAGHFDVGFLGFGGVPATFDLVGSPIGVRFGSCATHLTADLRPTAGVWGSPTTLSAALSFGVSLSVGYVFGPSGSSAGTPTTGRAALPKTERCEL